MIEQQLHADFYQEFDLSPLPLEVVDRAGLPVDTSTEQWLVNDAAGNFVVNWSTFNAANPAIDYAMKRYVLQRIKTVSPREAHNTWKELKSLSKSNHWEDLKKIASISETETFMPQLLSERLEKLRRKNTPYQFARIRAWYIWCTNQELPGFNSEVMYDLLKIKIPGNPKGLAVMTDDLNEGPLTDAETTVLRVALSQDTGPILERICVWLCLAFGCNPANFILLREDDYKKRTFENLDYSFAEIKIPRIKKRGLRHQRAEFKTRKVDDRLAELLDALIEHNKTLNISRKTSRPLLMRSSHHETRIGTALEEYSQHLSSEEFTKLVRKCSKRLNILSPRTGHLLELTPRRLRYTFATAMVRQGASAAELADLLDHTDLQHVQVYYNARSTIVERLDSALAEKLAPLVAQFSGKVIDKNSYEASNPNSRIKYQEKANPKKIHGIGVCGANFLCKLYPPLSCYLCEKFQPFKDAPHTKILEELTSWRQSRLEQQGENDRIAQQLDDVIYRVAQVKTICEKSQVTNEK